MQKTFFPIKILFLIYLFFINTSLSQALSKLPPNSYLRIGDNQKEVKILQGILNSDPDTLIVDKGVGSPGKEGWFFGNLTLQALENFQSKNKLEVTGKVDLATFKSLNTYVDNFNKPKTTIEIKKNVPLTQIKPEIKETSNTDNSNDKKTLLNSIFDKYVGLFSNKSPVTTNTILQNQDSYSNNYSSKTPYLNPQTGVYSSNPNNTQPPQPSQSDYAQQSPVYQNSNPYLQTPFSDSFANGMQAGPVAPPGFQSSQTFSGGSVGSGNFDGAKGTQTPRPGVQYESDGWVTGNKATNFGCNDTYACSHFAGSSQGSCNNTSMGHLSKGESLPINTDCNLFLVGIPQEIQRYFFGNLPLAPLYKIAAGTPIEVVNLSNNRCTVVPLWETGPGRGEGANKNQVGGAIDLTKSVKLLLGGWGNNFPVRYRPVPKDQKGCQNYDFIDPNNKGLNIPTRK